MTLLLWLVVGVIGGIIANRMIPTMNISDSLIAGFIAIVGSIGGGFAASLLGISAANVVVNLMVALAGSLLVLFFYRQYLMDVK